MRRWTIPGALVLGLSVVAAPAAMAAERSETAVTSSSPVSEVRESVVRVKIPLPKAAGARPPECDWLSYLRYRHEDGPAESAKAHRVLVAQPGILEGAGAFDGVARNTVAAAAKSGRHIEFWALDRRSNCLEDNAGVLAGVAAKDSHVAVDYYYRKKPVNGRAFSGYRTNDQVKFLQHVGLEQTLRDQYDLLAAELPGQKLRKQKVLCGGHSLGGSITGFFALSDFDGNPATTADAGYEQCGGYFALDTRIRAGIPVGDEQLAVNAVPATQFGPAVVQAGLEAGVIPRALGGPALINPETMNLLAIAGLAAHAAPTGLSDLATYIPASFNTDSTYRLLFSKDYPTFVTGSPTVKDFKFTNNAALGGLLDDNSQPLAFLQSSVGFFTGGPIADKSFPAPNDLVVSGNGGLAAFLGTERKAIPDRPNGPLYGWQNYDELSGVPNAADGKPFTTPAKEVTDIAQLARSLAEHPLDFTEDYFPTRLITDITLRVAPGAVHPGGITANPTLNLQGGDGLGARDPQPGDVIAPGYQHIDVLTASPVQNDGRPEPISTALAAFAGR
ncbi:hypothetical protein [Actinomadura flavalba]|uniref:hypothetical protein n=1 Tax=Actinomadura flavalba TaxID=1120938 RepID=UPI0003812893|nr:hypothetical protein [Actinomadura flavalba]